MVVLDEREFNLAGLFRFAECPAAGVNFGRVVVERAEQDAGGEE